MNRKIIALFLAALGLAVAVQAQIDISNDQPLRGEKVIISLAEPDSLLVVTYRPNSSIARTDTLRADKLSTTFEWAPRKAGVASLSTSTASRNVSVRFLGLSGSGIAVMAVAATLLFGGATFAFRLLFKDEEEDGTLDMDLDQMPDT